MGFAGTYGNYQAFRWTKSGGMQIIGSGLAIGVSADGSTVVGDIQGAGGDQAFVWTQAGGMVNIGPGYATGISADGSVVVGSFGIWTQAGGMQSLTSILANSGIDLTGWDNFVPNAISADGCCLTGYASHGGQTEAFWINLGSSSIPDAGACLYYLLFVTSLLLLVDFTLIRHRSTFSCDSKASRQF